MLQAAQSAGAETSEAYLSRTRRAEVRVRDGSIERTVQSDGLGCGLRLDRDGRQGFSSTSDLSAEGIRLLIDSALAVLEVAEEDPDAAIPEIPAGAGERGSAHLEMEDPGLLDLDFDHALDLARRTELGALSEDDSVGPGEGSLFGWGGGTVAIATSRGVRRAYSGTHCSLVCSPVAERDGERQRQNWFESRRHLRDLPAPEEVGARAARRATRMLGARPIPSGRVHVVFDPMEGSRFWSSITSALMGDAARRKVTFLADGLGRQVASSTVTLSDDPLRPGSPGSRPFDGEGLSTRRRELIQEGTLTAFYYDSRTGRKAGAASTASAVRGYASPPSPGVHAPVLEAGRLTPEEIMKEAGRGLYVTQLIGFGTNLVTGDYSRGASGWWFEGGEYAHPVQEVTLSGNLKEILRGVSLVGSDLDPRSGSTSPTFLVEGLVASGGGR